MVDTRPSDAEVPDTKNILCRDVDITTIAYAQD